MPNGIAHITIAATVVGGVTAYSDSQAGVQSPRPVAAAALAALLADLPDRLEPAVHPHHRQFFHSFVVGAAVGHAAYQLYQWQPTEEWHKAIRFGLLVACGAYLAHLAADATTARSIPVLGTLS